MGGTILRSKLPAIQMVLRGLLALVSLLSLSPISGVLVLSQDKTNEMVLFAIENHLLKDAAGATTRINRAPGISLESAGVYKVTVQFLHDQPPPTDGSLIFRRVVLYQAITRAGDSGRHQSSVDCVTTECWLQRQAFSISGGDSQEKNLGVSKPTQWLITSWAPDNRPGDMMTRGLSLTPRWTDETVSQKGVQAVRLEFPSRYGATVITISHGPM